MKPYGRVKNLKGSGPWKKDYRPRPKRKWMNWWEDMITPSKKKARQKAKREIRKEIDMAP